MALAFTAFAVVEGPGGWAVLQAREGGEVTGSQESAVEAAGSVMVAADASGVPGSGGDAGNAREPVGGLERAKISTDIGKERRGEDWTEAGHALDDLGVLVLVEPASDHLVELDQLRVDRGDLGGQTGYEGGTDNLGWQHRYLLASGVDCFLSNSSDIAATALLQPCRQTDSTESTQSRRCLIPR